MSSKVASGPPIYRISEIEVDATRACVRRDGQEIHLKPKVLQILIHFLANRDRLVTRDELMELFWPGTVVSDDALAQCITELRRVFGDSPKNPAYLKTVPKMGYRFVAEVQEVRPGPAPEPAMELLEERPSPVRNTRRPWLIGGALAVTLVAGLFVWRAQWPSAPPAPAHGKRQVAVLWFENRSGDAKLDWLRHGLPDMLTTTLSRARGLDVVSRDQVSLWLGRSGQNGLEAAMDLARRSRTEAAVLGSFAAFGTSIRVDAQIYDARTGALLGAEGITADSQDQLLAQVDLLSARIAARLSTKASDDGRSLPSLMTDNLEAYRYYSLSLEKADSFQIDEAIALLKKAIELDPNFAMAHARIGYADSVMGGRLPEGKPFLEKAFQMSARLTERDRWNIMAWYALANQDYKEAIQRYTELKTAFPNEPDVYRGLAGVLRGQGRQEEAIAVLKQGLAIDPEDPQIYNGLSSSNSELGRHSEAIAMAERYVALSPTDPNAYDSLGLALQMAGQFDRAAEAYTKSQTVNPAFAIPIYHQAVLAFQTGRDRDALRGFERYASATQNILQKGRAWNAAAWLHWRRGNIAKSLAALRRAGQFNEPGAPSWQPISLLVPDAPKRPPVIPTFGRGGAYSVRPMYFYLAQESRARHATDEMLADLRATLDHKPQWGSQEILEDCLADAYLELGRVDEAIAEYERALRLFPGMPLARYHLGQAYLRKGQADAAREQFRLFLDLWKGADADLPELAEAKRRLP